MKLVYSLWACARPSGVTKDLPSPEDAELVGVKAASQVHVSS
jgi:hypothetical protein